MGSDESHFNVSVESDGQNHKTVSANHNLLSFKDGRMEVGEEGDYIPITTLSPPERLLHYGGQR